MSIVFAFMGFEPAIELNNNNNRLLSRHKWQQHVIKTARAERYSAKMNTVQRQTTNACRYTTGYVF